MGREKWHTIFYFIYYWVRRARKERRTSVRHKCWELSNWELKKKKAFDTYKLAEGGWNEEEDGSREENSTKKIIEQRFIGVFCAGLIAPPERKIENLPKPSRRENTEIAEYKLGWLSLENGVK